MHCYRTLHRMASAVAFTVTLAFASAASGQGVNNAALVEAGKKEGALTVYHATDAVFSKPLFDGFTKKYGIPVTGMDIGTTVLHNRIISEAAANQVTADIAWSNTMNLMMTLAKDGYAEEYKSTESGSIPAWANYNNMLYATTVEPFGVVYNTDALKAEELPKTYADMTTFLKQSRLKGKVATYDPEKAGTSFLSFKFDSEQRSDFWDWAKALGASGVKMYSGSGSLKESVLSGENSLALAAIASYGLGWAKETPKLAVHFYTDYTPAASRLALITKGAPHPNAAKLFLDYMLSAEGQQLIAAAGLPSVRSDVKDVLNIDTLNQRVGGHLKPIPLSEKLLEYAEPTKRVAFLKEWKAALGR